MAQNKTIVIDFGKITTPYCGLAEVAFNYADALNKISPKGLQFIYIVPTALRTQFDQRMGQQIVLTPNYRGLSRVLFYLTGKTSLLCKLPGFDVYHYLHFYSPWGPGNKYKQKTLLTIHDFHALDRKRAAKRLHAGLNNSDYLTFISNFAAAEYTRLLPEYQHRTRVITNGVKVPPSVSLQASQKLTDHYGEFLFTLGGLKRKNIHSLLGMMQVLSEKKATSQIKLIVAGGIKDKYKAELEKEIHARHIAQKVEFLGAISEQDKFKFIHACRAFVFPSLQEGFGLPIIEAMHFAKPVFCSDKTSLPEVGGDYVYYWRDFEPNSMADVLINGLLENDNNLNSLEPKRKQHAQGFDWQANAQQYVELYKSILARSE